MSAWAKAEQAVFSKIKTRTGGEAFLDQPLQDDEDGPLYNYWCMNSGLGGGDVELYEAECHSSHDFPVEFIGVYESREECQKLFTDVSQVLTDEGAFRSNADVDSFILSSTPVIIRDDSERGAIYSVTFTANLRFSTN